MEGIQVTAAGKKLLFTATGDVADASVAPPVIRGSWQATSAAKDNTIGYSVDGVAQPPLAAVYRFTPDNQLSVALQGDAASAACVFPGMIEVDRNHDFVYHVIDSTGAETGARFALYGDIKFEESTNDLVVHLTGGGEAHVLGDTGTQSLEAARNHSASFRGEDLLTYHSSTINQFPGQQDPIVKPAVLDFAGGWDVQDGSVVFLSEVKSSGGTQAVTLGFGGKFKGVTAGFVYHVDGDSPDIALNISGQHVFRSDRATTSLAWETTIGYSAKSFSAQVKVESSTSSAQGQTLSVKGLLHIEHGTAAPLQLDLELEAKYTTRNGELIFRANVQDDGIQTAYDLMLQGSFAYSNLKLTFTADFGNAAGANRVAVSVGIEGNRQSMIQNLKLILNISNTDAAAQVNLSFEARMRFVNGHRVIEKAAPPRIETARTA
jgi:hypothetical protein